VKPILPGAPMPIVELQKEQPMALMPPSENKPAPAVSRKKSAAREDQKQDRQVIGGYRRGRRCKKNRDTGR